MDQGTGAVLSSITVGALPMDPYEHNEPRHFSVDANIDIFCLRMSKDICLSSAAYIEKDKFNSLKAGY